MGDGYMNERAEVLSSGANMSRLRLRAIVVALVLAVAGIAGWLLLGGDDNGRSAPGPAAAVAASPARLHALSGELGHDVFWAGSRSDVTYELTRTAKGKVFIRYLPSGVKVGDPRPDFLTVGTYPRPDAYSVVKRFSTMKDAVSRKIGSGGIAAYSSAAPKSVYVAYPDSDIQIEVYDPAPGRAMRLVSSGQVEPIP